MADLSRKLVPLYLTEDEKSALDEFAGKMRLSRQELLEGIINTAIDEIAMVDCLNKSKKGSSVWDDFENLDNKFEGQKKLC